MKRTILLAAAITGVVFLSGCTDTSAKDATEAVKSAYTQAIQESEVANEGKSLGEFIDQAHGYNELYLKLTTLDKNLSEGSDADYSDQYETYFGSKPTSAEEAKQWTDDALGYIVEEDRDLLSPFIRTMKDSTSVSEGNFEDQKASFKVEDTAALLNELHLSADSFGKILAMTDIYASKIDFSETGFDFSWDGTGGEFTLKLVPPADCYVDFVEKFNEGLKIFDPEGAGSDSEVRHTTFLDIDETVVNDVDGAPTYNPDLNRDGNYREYFEYVMNDEQTDWKRITICCYIGYALSQKDAMSYLGGAVNFTDYEKTLMYATQENATEDEITDLYNAIVKEGKDKYIITKNVNGIQYTFKSEDGPALYFTAEK